MRMNFLILLFALFQISCESMLSDKSSQVNPSRELSVLSADSTVVPIPGKLQIIQDSFVFFYPNERQGFFLYPQTNLQLFKTHFFVQLKAADVITCGVIQKNDTKKHLTIRAELLKSYYGDVSGVASFCAGNNATVYSSDGKNTFVIKTELFSNSLAFKKKTPHLVFPYIPYFVDSLSDIASPGNKKIKIFVKIEFFDRISKSTLTNCTYYKVNGEDDATCYGIPIIYPETSFYGEKYKAKQLRPVKALAEYLEKSSDS